MHTIAMGRTAYNYLHITAAICMVESVLSVGSSVAYDCSVSLYGYNFNSHNSSRYFSASVRVQKEDVYYTHILEYNFGRIRIVNGDCAENLGRLDTFYVLWELTKTLFIILL